MKLYNKIQELINESETLKQKNNEVLGLAKNELSELVNNKANENLESLKKHFSRLFERTISRDANNSKKKC
ncbi:hypothetical protein HpHA134_12740 [Helicobacter pylori]